MSFFAALVAEILDTRAPWVAGAAALAVLLGARERSDEGRRRRSLVVLTATHGVFVVLCAGLRAVDAAAYPDVRVVSRLVAALVAASAGGALLFQVLLPALRIRAPRIVQDVLVAGTTIVACVIVASRSGLNLSGIIATSAVLTAVIGFSLQDTLGNVIGGLALQTDDSIQVGDWVKVNDVNGRVTEIRWRYTAIETRNWETVFIPNAVLLKNQVTVLGRRRGSPRQWRRWVYFTVDYRHPPTTVIDAVEGALRGAAIPNVAAEPPPNCIVIDFQESLARYAVRYWLTDLAVDDPTDSAVRVRVHYALRRSNIALSMPAHAVFLTEETGDRRANKAQRQDEQRAVALERVDLFASLPPDDRALLASNLHFAPFARGEVLTRQGAQAHWLYIVAQGQVSVRVSVDGEQREVAQLGSGTFFGEMSLLTGAARSATVVALTEVECWRLDKAAFKALLDRRPEVAEDVAETLAARQVELEAVRDNLTAEARKRRVEASRQDLLARIRDFFASDDTGRPSIG